MSNNYPRVVVTGTGVYAPIGRDVESFWQGCLEKRSNIEKTPEFWTRYSKYISNNMSMLPDHEYGKSVISGSESKRLDRSTLLILEAVNQAFEQAGIEKELTDPRNHIYSLTNVDADEISVNMGTGIGGIRTFADNYGYHLLSQTIKNKKEHLSEEVQEEFAEMKIPRRFNPYSVSMIMPSAVAANISVKFGVHGYSRCHPASCASGTIAIGNAFHAIRSGETTMAITGGVEYLSDHNGSFFKSFDCLNVVTPNDEGGFPFNEDRAGFLFTEGAAAALILETEESAKARGAKILGEVVAYSENNDAYNIVRINPDGEKIELMINKLLKRGGISAEQVDYINAHGTGTVENDLVEEKMIANVFGKNPSVNSTKGLVGHSLGASGGLEAVVALKSIETGLVHGNKNNGAWMSDRISLSADVVERDVNYAISESFGFGGHNSALLFKKYEA